MTFYGIRYKITKTTVGFETRSAPPDADCCVDVSYELDTWIHPDSVWLVRDKNQAKKVLKEPSTVWYNAGYETPEKPDNFKDDDYEVFEIEI